MGAPTRYSAIQGAAWSVAIRWTDRLLGLASTVVLARLLTPEDFGLIAIATLVIGLLESLFDLGVATALVRDNNATREDFDAAWTLRLLEFVAIALATAASAPLVASHFHEPRIVPIILILSVAILVSGFENIGLVYLQKELNVRREFLLFIVRRGGAFLVTVILALLLRSYWALVAGTLSARILAVLVSYVGHSFRPHLSFRRIGGIWTTSRWIVLRSIVGYLTGRVDRFILGNVRGADSVGLLTVADEIAALPTTELVLPISRVLLPLYAEASADRKLLSRTYLLSLGIQASIAIPAVGGMYCIAGDAVYVLLGPKWSAAVPVVQVLVLAAGLNAISHSGAYVLTALGRLRGVTIMNIFFLAILGTSLFAIGDSLDPFRIAVVRTSINAALFVPFCFLVVSAVEHLTLNMILSRIWRPLAATLAMAGLLTCLAPALQAPPLVRLLALIPIGAAAYLAALGALWRVAGRPDGAEAYLIAKLKYELLVRNRPPAHD